MLTASDIKNITFSKSISGFKTEEVDDFLDKVEEDYVQFERTVREYQEKIEKLNQEIAGYKSSQESIQNVLLSAQKLADQIISEAKEKSDEIVNNAETSISAITAHEKELANTFELKAQERKTALEKELNAMVVAAQNKAEAITKAAEDSVARQQSLFDRLKLEIAGFKASLSEKYKEHLSLLSTIPDTAPTDPQKIASAVARSYEQQIDPAEYIASGNEISSNTEDDGFKVELTDLKTEEADY